MTGGDDSAHCPKCGQGFACCVGQGADCWCGEIKLSSAQRSYIAANFVGCLCRDCLQQILAADPIRILELD